MNDGERFCAFVTSIHWVSLAIRASRSSGVSLPMDRPRRTSPKIPAANPSALSRRDAYMIQPRAQRVPVRVKLGAIPDDVHLVSGTTASVVVKPGS